MNLNELIQQAVANRRETTYPDGTVGLHYLSSASWASPVGRIVCFADHSVKNPGRNFNKHVRLTFDLNHKRIARAKLEAMLKA